MPYMSIQPNFYRATFRPSSEMLELRTISTDGGYNIIVGKCTDGALRVQSALFPKSKYNIAQATISAHFMENIWM
jgi:hypothetical protein